MFKALARPCKPDDGSFNIFSFYMLLLLFLTGASIFYSIIGRDYNKMVKKQSLKC